MTMNSSVMPLKFPRLISLFLAWAWALISLAIGINAFVKSNRDKKSIESEVPGIAKVSIDTNDILQAGIVVTVVSVLILSLTTLILVILVIDANSRSGISTRTLPLQCLLLSFLAIWLFATQIPVSLFVSKRSVQVSASIDGINVPNNVLKAIEHALSVKTQYKQYAYLNLLAILPWFAVIFTTIAAVISFLAWRSSSGGLAKSQVRATPPVGNDKEKALPPDPNTANSDTT